MGLIRHFKRDEFLFVDSKRWSELLLVGELETDADLKRRCKMYSDAHPDMDAVRFFVISHTGQRCGLEPTKETKAGTVYTKWAVDALARGGAPIRKEDPFSVRGGPPVGCTVASSRWENYMEVSCTTLWWAHHGHLYVSRAQYDRAGIDIDALRSFADMEHSAAFGGA